MDFDLVVVGAGPVGASLARAARGLSVAILARERATPAETAGFDSRVYALSPGNVSFLRQLHVWDEMPAQRLLPVHQMRIFGDQAPSEIRFDAYRAGVPELAWIVEDRVLQEALWRAVQLREDVEIFAPAQCASLEVTDGRATLVLSDGREVYGRLVVGADGADSFVRGQAGIAAVERDYGQAAVVANFACEHSHGNTAFQWFQRGPVLALLPLPHRHVSMVWSLPSAEAQRILLLAPEALCHAIEEVSRHALGRMSLVTPPRSYPLRRLCAQRLVAPRIALVGDAAHVIHPLAGQGLNLGLQDVRALAALLGSRESVRSPGDLRLLRRYERSRAEPILTMDAMVDGLFTLFGSDGAAISRLRNGGLNLSDRIPVLKNALMRHAMG